MKCYSLRNSWKISMYGVYYRCLLFMFSYIILYIYMMFPPPKKGHIVKLSLLNCRPWFSIFHSFPFIDCTILSLNVQKKIDVIGSPQSRVQGMYREADFLTSVCMSGVADLVGSPTGCWTVGLLEMVKGGEEHRAGWWWLEPWNFMIFYDFPIILGIYYLIWRFRDY